MAKVTLISGKICSGESTLAEKLRLKKRAVVLSVDEITLAIFGQFIGEKHDEVVEKTQKYLFDKSLKLIECGVNVILDWGFWQRQERDEARNFYLEKGIETEFYYIDITEEEWKRRVAKRNQAVKENNLSAYFVDENLRIKFSNLFEPPTEDENMICVR
ncbi:MAG: ATP-binding protein [Clostridia bacterium]|nr:ATP-binding protein [Clostridia bacterium]